jgi:hypothetical protein
MSVANSMQCVDLRWIEKLGISNTNHRQCRNRGRKNLDGRLRDSEMSTLVINEI